MSKITGLYIYPIKSCGSTKVTTVTMEPQGLKDDRRFMIVDRNGRFITSRTHPKLVCILPTLTDSTLHIEGSNHGSVTIDIPPRTQSRMDVKLWKADLNAQLCEDSAHRFFSDYLGEEVYLVYKDSETHRLSSIGSDISFADTSPLHLLSEASLIDLNAKLERPINITNFRPNVVVDGLSAYEEDTLKQFTIKDVSFVSMGPCGRCSIITVDPDSGVVDHKREPLRTLATYRRGEKGKINFGYYFSPLSTGCFSVGDDLKVDKRFT